MLVNGDTLDENDENFFLNLSNALNASIVDAQGLGTIIDDDPLPSVAIGDVTVTEGDTGTVTASFNVTLAPASGRQVSVSYATADGTATASADYSATSGGLTFAAGETTKLVTVPVHNDVLDEIDESFTVGLTSPVDATISDDLGLGTITDNDPLPALSDQRRDRDRGRRRQRQRELHGQPRRAERAPGDRRLRDSQRHRDSAC